jgi:hypothetical protein
MKTVSVDNVLIKEAKVNLDGVEGVYAAHWSGYECWFNFGGEKYRFRTKDGVRGIDVHCLVRISNGEITVE